MGPQSTIFFLLLVVAFGALIWWLVVARHVVFRVLAACLAFLPAMLFGVAAVNKYYDYYQTWGSAYDDIFGQNSQGTQLPSRVTGSSGKLSSYLGSKVDAAVAAQDGYTFHATVHGRLSDISRTVYVYLPPQYFQSAYRDYRFPAIELLHGFPGTRRTGSLSSASRRWSSTWSAPARPGRPCWSCRTPTAAAGSRCSA